MYEKIDMRTQTYNVPPQEVLMITLLMIIGIVMVFMVFMMNTMRIEINEKLKDAVFLVSESDDGDGVDIDDHVGDGDCLGDGVGLGYNLFVVPDSDQGQCDCVCQCHHVLQGDISNSYLQSFHKVWYSHTHKSIRI